MEALRQLKAEIQQLEARTLRRSVGLRRTFNAERAVLVGGARAKPSRKKKAKKKAKKRPRPRPERSPKKRRPRPERSPKKARRPKQQSQLYKRIVAWLRTVFKD
jgi:hypothetical protein